MVLGNWPESLQLGSLKGFRAPLSAALEGPFLVQLLWQL